MIGILGLYLANLAQSNIESLMNAYSDGKTFNMHGGMLGKGIKKATGGKLDAEAIKVAFTNSQSKKAISSLVAKGAVKGLSNYFFNPYVLAARTAGKMIYDSQKAYRDEQFNKEVFDLPIESDKYMIDERFQTVSNNSFRDMERTDFSVRQLLGSENIAGSMIDRAFGRM